MGNLNTIFGDNEIVLTLRLRERQHHGNCHQQKPWYCRDVFCPPAENTQCIQSLKMETGQILLRLHVTLTENKSAVCGLPQHFPLAAAPAVWLWLWHPRVSQGWSRRDSLEAPFVLKETALSRHLSILPRPIKKWWKREKQFGLFGLSCWYKAVHTELDL